jgi:hypothetical protein
MAQVIRLRPHRRTRQHHIGAALKSVMDDVTRIERSAARLTWGSTVCGLALGLALQAFA